MGLIEFDTATAFFIAGIMYILISCTVRWVLLRYETRASNAWTVGGICIGLALILFSYRTHLNDLLAYSVTNFLLYAGLFLKFYGLLKEFQKLPSVAVLSLLPIAFFAVYEYLRVFYFSGGWNFIWGSTVIGLSLITVGGFSISNGRRADSNSALWIGMIYCLGGSILIVRNFLIFATTDTPTPLSPHVVNSVAILLGLFSGVLSNFAYLGIFLEKSTRQSARMAAENARLEESVRLNEQLAHLDRQRAIGAIATSLCHELSQPLTNVSVICDYGLLEISQKSLPLDRQKTIFSDIARNATLGREILERIRQFIRPGTQRHQPQSLYVIANEVHRLVMDSCKKEGVQIRIIPPQKEPLVTGDSIQLSQILLNLYRNAMQAMQGQSRKEIEVRFSCDDQKVCVYVKDNGPGLAPDMIGRVGTPFLTSKADGLGVGFSISRSLAQQHGGQLSIDNAPDGGALAELRLPALA